MRSENPFRAQSITSRFYREYMETQLFPDEADQKQLRDFYLRKYQYHRPDVIITVGSSPLGFVAKERGKHFAGIPSNLLSRQWSRG